MSTSALLAGQLLAPTQPEISEHRLELMEMAVELEVDRNDFGFHHSGEEAVWDELQAEFEIRAERLGRTWVAEAA